ncbi:MAG: hypothetical protein HXY20_09270 [Acidobacteria bacterium]|nr:hypothetical protein [Acidobacteriota bacterium]
MIIGRYSVALAAQCFALLTAHGLQAESVRTNPTEIRPKAEAAVPYSSVRYDSDHRRDPFLSPIAAARKGENLDVEEPRGEPPPGISGMYIAQVRLVGTSLSDISQTAVLQGQDHRAYFLQEGDRLFDGYLKEIGLDYAVLVRETKLKSGKVVTEVVTKRLRTP